MKLSDFLSWLKEQGEVILSEEDVQKLIADNLELPDSKVLRIGLPKDREIRSYYGERKENELL